MNIALFNKERIKPTPNFHGAICQLCNEIVIAKCGKIKQWHWSHKADNDCDSFGEGETDWHINWKNEFPKEMQEIVIEKYIPSSSGDSGGMEKHRADIRNKNGTVIELQNSSISSDDIKEREQFYGDMIWLINGNTFAKGLDLRCKDNPDIFTFRWKHPPKSWWFAEKQIYIDLTSEIEYYKSLQKKYNNNEIFLHEIKLYTERPIFQLKKIYKNIPCGGYGYLITKKEFLKTYRGKNGATDTK